MKTLCLAGAALLLVSQFLCNAQAMDLCESEDYYNLADSSKCKIKYNEGAGESDSRELMFEVLKNYPYEYKDNVIKLLQRKIERVDNYIIEQHRQKQTEKVQFNIGKLEQAREKLFEQLGLVKTATADNWAGVRDRATKELKAATIELQEVELETSR